MFKRLLWLAILGGGAWYVYNSGLWYGLTHDLEPEPGRTAKVVGTYSDLVYVARSKDDTCWPIDAHIGSEGQRAASKMELQSAIRKGFVHIAPDDTRVEVIDADKVIVHGVKFGVVKLKILDSELAGRTGWVMREDVVDTPLQEVYKALGNTKRRTSDTEETTSSGD